MWSVSSHPKTLSCRSTQVFTIKRHITAFNLRRHHTCPLFLLSGQSFNKERERFHLLLLWDVIVPPFFNRAKELPLSSGPLDPPPVTNRTFNSSMYLSAPSSVSTAIFSASRNSSCASANRFQQSRKCHLEYLAILRGVSWCVNPPFAVARSGFSAMVQSYLIEGYCHFGIVTRPLWTHGQLTVH